VAVRFYEVGGSVEKLNGKYQSVEGSVQLEDGKKQVCSSLVFLP
jgi:hypothetical protein